MCAKIKRRCSVFSTKKKISQSDNNLFRKLKAKATTRLWVVLTIVFASWLAAGAADLPTGKAQIQAGNLRIEFDDRLRSRVIACFDEKQTGLGPFTASETVTTADKAWTGFLLTSQKHERTKDERRADGLHSDSSANDDWIRGRAVFLRREGSSIGIFRLIDGIE